MLISGAISEKLAGMSDIIAITVFVVIALLIGASIAFGRGSNRCAVKPRIEEG